MSFLRPSALYQFLIAYHSLRWMPCQSWAFLRWPSLEGILRLFIVALLWAMFAEIRYISSSSMNPTLHVRDRIVVQRASYFIRRPAVNDIVLFRAPSQVHGGQLYVNRIARNEEFIAERPTYITNATALPHYFRLDSNKFQSQGEISYVPIKIHKQLRKCIYQDVKPSFIGSHLKLQVASLNTYVKEITFQACSGNNSEVVRSTWHLKHKPRFAERWATV
ncbi:hypothetical protein RJ639_038734 [Escallonia herrerae]|uniref:Peptidase S26 domain-containing protein n=1 Tax=Escallonia herrerae TaxID=1293975 RepID=A0AA88WL22_9ASTE|nr:hypothetical protein RJ639_038734 [Escallonia herrerae]